MLKARQAHTGYSLHELLIVLALFTLILSLSVSCFYSADTILVHRELDRLYALMIYTQRAAILKGKQQTLAIKKISFSKGVLFARSVHILPTQPSRAIKKPITWIDGLIQFYPDGTISAGALYLTNRRKTCLFALTCDASSMSHIRRYYYTGKWILIK